MGGATLAGLIPSLKAWLVRFARDAILSHYVLPEQWCFRLDPVSLRIFQWRYAAAAADIAAALLLSACKQSITRGIAMLSLVQMLPVRHTRVANSARLHVPGTKGGCCMCCTRHVRL